MPEYADHLRCQALVYPAGNPRPYLPRRRCKKRWTTDNVPLNEDGFYHAASDYLVCLCTQHLEVAWCGGNIKVYTPAPTTSNGEGTP